VVHAESDIVLGDGSNDLCKELRARGIPVVIYSGMPKPPEMNGIYIEKPASGHLLISAIEQLLADKDAVKPMPGVVA
jgi:hypothetical protein